MITPHAFNTGGLGFSLHNIGTALGIVGIMLIPLSLLMFYPVSDVYCSNLYVSMNVATYVRNLT